MMFENNVGNPDTFPGIEAWIMQPSHLSSSCASTVGHNARSVLSNTDCAISKQLFLQQPASLQSTNLYTEKIYKSMPFNFENLLHCGAPPTRHELVSTMA